MTIRVPLPIPNRPRGHAQAIAQMRGAAPAPAVASTLHERLCAKLALSPSASNADVLAALDARLARQSAPAGLDPALASLYARAFGTTSTSTPTTSPLATIAAKAGWGV